MSGNTPSKCMKEGMEAYCPESDPEESCPYKGENLSSTYFREWWIDGWYKAEVAYKQPEPDKDIPYIRNQIYSLSADPELIEVLDNILEYIERKCHG